MERSEALTGVDSGAAGMLRPGRLCDAGAGQLRGRQPVRGRAAGRAGGGAGGAARVLRHVSFARRLFRHRHLGDAEVFRLSIANIAAVGGGSGTTLTALRGIEKATRVSVTYWMALACLVAAIAGVYLFLRSKQGLALLAIRDNEVAGDSQGIAVRRMKLAVYMVAAFGAGLAGALYFVSNLRMATKRIGISTA